MPIASKPMRSAFPFHDAGIPNPPTWRVFASGRACGARAVGVWRGGQVRGQASRVSSGDLRRRTGIEVSAAIGNVRQCPKSARGASRGCGVVYWYSRACDRGLWAVLTRFDSKPGTVRIIPIRQAPHPTDPLPSPSTPICNKAETFLYQESITHRRNPPPSPSLLPKRPRS